MRISVDECFCKEILAFSVNLVVHNVFPATEYTMDTDDLDIGNLPTQASDARGVALSPAQRASAKEN